MCLDSRRHVCDYANNVYIFLPAFFVDALELCLFICFRGLYVSKCACEYVGWWWQMPLAVWKCLGLNVSSESKKRRRPLESNRRSFWLRKKKKTEKEERFKYFLSVSGRKESHSSENNNKWSTEPAFFPHHPSRSLFPLVSHCQTLFPHYIYAVPSQQKSPERLHSSERYLSLLVFPLCVDHMDPNQPSPGKYERGLLKSISKQTIIHIHADATYCFTAIITFFGGLTR